MWRERLASLARHVAHLSEYAVTRASDPLAALEALCHAQIELLTRHPWIPCLIFQATMGGDRALKRELVSVAGEQRRGIGLLLATAHRQGLLASTLRTSIVADTLIVLLQGLALRLRLGEPVPRVRRTGRELVSAYLGTVRA